MKDAVATRCLPEGRLPEQPFDAYPPQSLAGERMIGASAVMVRMFGLIERVAARNVTVIITGETGTGKELVAQAIHALSPRRCGRFVPVQCSTLAPGLLESELFGHVKGSFTGAVGSRRGLFEEADGGTIFLDELSTMALDTQVKILRVLQERVVRRVGASDLITTDFRLIAATNVSLRAEVASGRFREDLYYRLNVFPIRVPALRERRGDIPLLADSFRRRFAERNAVDPPAIPPAVVERMTAYDWPGNVRELENFVERAMIVWSDEPAIRFEPPRDKHLCPATDLLAKARSDGWSLSRLVREYTLDVLERMQGHAELTAAVLGHLAEDPAAKASLLPGGPLTRVPR
jgi:DNA-binding NtrC family response regulator